MLQLPSKKRKSEINFLQSEKPLKWGILPEGKNDVEQIKRLLSRIYFKLGIIEKKIDGIGYGNVKKNE